MLHRIPYRMLSIAAAVALGALVGVGAFTFGYGKGFSYFSTEPEACINCHIMQPEYDSWQRSSHGHVAVCVDCHLPHEFVAKYIAKADNGWRHSWAFTFQDFHEPIKIHPRNARILQNNCIKCHETTVHDMLAGRPPEDANACVHCHAGVGHAAR
jgi:cytochrome c nitrite reductase small subunit